MNLFNNVIVNGKKIPCFGRNIVISNNQVIVDGKITADNLTGNVEVVVNGDVAHLECAGSVKIRGNAGSVDCGGSCTVGGDVSGDIDAGGSVTCDKVGGDIDAGGGVKCGRLW